MGDIYTGIDLGTNSIKIVVSEKVNDKYNVLASVSSPSLGIKNGFVSDTKAACNSIKNAVKQINDSLGILVFLFRKKNIQLSHTVDGAVD